MSENIKRFKLLEEKIPIVNHKLSERGNLRFKYPSKDGDGLMRPEETSLFLLLLLLIFSAISSASLCVDANDANDSLGKSRQLLDLFAPASESSTSSISPSSGTSECLRIFFDSSKNASAAVGVTFSCKSSSRKKSSWLRTELLRLRFAVGVLVRVRECFRCRCVILSRNSWWTAIMLVPTGT